jgi:KipI family sensor histidine kinase inhibitor
MKHTTHRYGDRAVLVDANDPVAIASAARRLPGVIDSVPGVRSVLLTAADAAALEALLPLVEQLTPDPVRDAQEVVELPVRYDGPDLVEVARLSGLTTDEVRTVHSGAVYVTALIGFVPGFGYLGGLDPVLHLPRRSEPRPVVPAGSVALAGGWTGVYPRATPGGWHLIGHTDETMWDLDRDPPALLRPGVRVRFTDITRRARVQRT